MLNLFKHEIVTFLDSRQLKRKSKETVQPSSSKLSWKAYDSLIHLFSYSPECSTINKYKLMRIKWIKYFTWRQIHEWLSKSLWKIVWTFLKDFIFHFRHSCQFDCYAPHAAIAGAPRTLRVFLSKPYSSIGSIKPLSHRLRFMILRIACVLIAIP